MKAGWEVKALGDICDFQNGFAFKSNLFLESGFPIIRISNIQNQQVIEDDLVYFNKSDYKENFDKYQVNKGDILIAMSGGTTGKIGVNTTESVFYLNQRVGKFIPKACLINQYLYYFLLTKTEESLIISAGSAQPNLSTEQIKNFQVPLPSTQEQQRIVAILDQAFEGIAKARANAEQNLQNARALFESHLQSVFTQRGEGWVEKSISEIAKIKGGKRVPKGYKLLSEPTNHPYLRVTDFNDTGSIDLRDLRYIDNDIFNEIKNYIIHDTDLYISIAGTIGKTGIIPKELDGANLTENACRLVFNSNVLNKYVYYFTTTKDFIEQAGVNTRTAAQPKLALSRLSTIKLGIPNLENQKKLVKEFDLLREKTQRLEALYQRKIACLDELKKSLLQQAFAGEL